MQKIGGAADSLPKISVAMGVKHSGDDITLLTRAVDSILNQNFPELELLICVKDSAGTVTDYLKEASERDNRIIILDGAGCRHLGGQLNRCIEHARGKFIARMDDDDFSTAERFDAQTRFLNENTDFAFVGSNVRLIRGGNAMGERRLPVEPQIRDFLFVQPFVHPTLMFRKSALETAGGYSDKENRRGCEDYDLLMRLYNLGLRGANIQQPLLDYTLPENGKAHRKFSLRVNESKTRFSLYAKMGLLPGALPYAIKPVAVGLLPNCLLERLKARRAKKHV